MRLAKLFVVLAAVLIAWPALAGSSANVIDIGLSAEPAAVVVLRGSSAPPQPWVGPPAPRPSSAPPPPAATYAGPTYVPLYFLPGYVPTAPRHAPQHALPTPQVPPAHPIRHWGLNLAPFQR